MLQKEKEFHSKIKRIFYLGVSVCLLISAIGAYQTWLNPLGLKPEVNPKQHNGAQPFAPPNVFESSVTLPDGRPTSTINLNTKIEQAPPLTEEDLEVFDELRTIDDLTDEEFQEKTQ